MTSTVSPSLVHTDTKGPSWVLFAPRAAFSSLTQRPRALLLIAILLGASVLPALAFVSQGNVTASMERQMKKSGAWEKLPEGNREETVAKIGEAMVFLGPLGALFKRALYLFGAGLLAWFLLKATRPELRLAVVLAAVALGMTPILFRDVLESLMFFVRDPMTINIDSPLKSHLGAFVPSKSSPALLAFASGIDLFSLWVAGLVGFGLRVVAQSKSSIPYMISFGIHAATVALAIAVS